MCLLIFCSSAIASTEKADFGKDQDLEVAVPEIIKTGTPGDVLIADPILPALGGEIGINSSSGSLQKTLQKQMALPVMDYGPAGGVTQLRGSGFSAEDVDIQILGISANPAQGGGFDLSTFPQYLWSSYRYQMGPALNALNQNASTGTLSLLPWTSSVLSKSGTYQAKGGLFSSSRGIHQISAGGSDGRNVSVLAGMSQGAVKGPSGSLSTQWKKGAYTGSFQVLATDLDTLTPGPQTFPTPHAHMRSNRVIPVLQNDFKLSAQSLLKTSLFYDGGTIHYEDPDFSSLYRSYSQQWGMQNVYLLNQWKFGLSARQVAYRVFSDFSGSQTAAQNIGTLQASRTLDFSPDTLLEPTIRAVWTTDFGFIPEGSLGLRKSWNQNRFALFSRVSYSSRTPSLQDRYIVALDFVGNPNLKTETDWTGTFGGEFKSAVLETSLQTFFQLKENARVSTGKTVNNFKDAYVASLTGSALVHLTSTLDTFWSGTLTHSRILLTGTEFPYLPVFLSAAGVTLHTTPSAQPGSSFYLEWGTNLRIASSQTTSVTPAPILPGYLTLDTEVSWTFSRGLSLSGRIENILDRPVELVLGYPVGLAFSLNLTGRI